MSDIQTQVSARVEAFVAEITELARQAAFDALNSALAQSHAGAGRSLALPRPRGRGGKRTPEELAAMAETFLDYVTKNPGRRMEQIAKELGYKTPELNLPVKKLLEEGKLRVEGQKRATQYYPNEPRSTASKGTTAKRSGVKVRRRKGRRKKS